MELIPIFGTLCTLSSFFFQLVGMQICHGVIKKGAVGEMSPFTFIIYFVSCSVWLKYGLLQNLFVVICVNLYGAVLNFLYIIVFYRYSSKKGPFHKFLFTGGFILVLPLIYVKYYQTDRQLAISHLGSYCVGLTVLGYGAPLVSLTEVLRTKSTESLSFLLICANIFTSILWTVYGGLIHDRYVQAPNVLGGFLALIQLSLFVFYPRRRVVKVVHT